MLPGQMGNTYPRVKCPGRTSTRNAARTPRQGVGVRYLSGRQLPVFVPWETDRLMCWNDARPLLRRAS